MVSRRVVVHGIEQDLHEVIAARDLEKDLRKGPPDHVGPCDPQNRLSSGIERRHAALEVDAQDTASHILQNHLVKCGGLHGVCVPLRAYTSGNVGAPVTCSASPCTTIWSFS